MMELLSFAVHPYNVIFTIFLGVILLYWLSVIIGVADLDMFDLDLDLDLDAEAELEGASINGGGGLLGGFQQFLFLGDVPLTLVASIFFLVLWIGVICTNYTIQPDSAKMAALLALPNIVVSFILTRFLLYPFRALFKRMNAQQAQLEDVIGLRGKVVSPASHTRLGQVEIEAKGAFVRINIRTPEDGEVQRGDHVKIISKEGPHSYLAVQTDQED